MIRGLVGAFITTFAVGLAGIANGHHPPKMERCASFSFTGQIERIEWRMPHVQLFVRADDGSSYNVSWLSINQLNLAGIDRDTLSIGDQVAITAGIRVDELVQRPLLLSYIHRDSDDWGWSQLPQGC